MEKRLFEFSYRYIQRLVVQHTNSVQAASYLGWLFKEFLIYLSICQSRNDVRNQKLRSSVRQNRIVTRESINTWSSRELGHMGGKLMTNSTTRPDMPLTPHCSNTAAQCSPVWGWGCTGELPAVNVIVWVWCGELLEQSMHAQSSFSV